MSKRARLLNLSRKRARTALSARALLSSQEPATVPESSPSERASSFLHAARRGEGRKGEEATAPEDNAAETQPTKGRGREKEGGEGREKGGRGGPKRD